MSLVTLEEVKDFLEIAEDDDGEDALLGGYIESVSRAFRNHTKREFEATDGQERHFAHRGGVLLNVDPYDLRSVSSVRIAVDSGSPKTLEEGEYRLRPLPAVDDVYQWIRFTREVWPGEVAIEGDWGFPEIPEDVKHWAKTQIALWMHRELQQLERTFSLDGQYLERPQDLASAVQGGLSDYERVSTL